METKTYVMQFRTIVDTKKNLFYKVDFNMRNNFSKKYIVKD